MLTLLAVAWQLASPGVWFAEMSMPGESRVPIRAVVVRINPSTVRFSLDRASRNFELTPAWTIARLPTDAVVAFNAGQFAGGAPWGWLVRDGAEAQPPGRGSLAMAFVVDKVGRVSLVTPGELPAIRAGAVHAFQSYPALLVDGRIPWELQGRDRGVDLTHRDSRLALGIMDDGSVLVALTRVDAIGRTGESIPWGPTVSEMAAFMESLGCRRAMMLDGGLSGQLALRGPDGLLTWDNWRAVPMGLVGYPVNQADTASSRRR